MIFIDWLFGQTMQRPPIPEALSVRLVANGREVGTVQIAQIDGIVQSPYRLSHFVETQADLPIEAVYYDRRTGETVATQEIDHAMPGRAVDISAFPGDRVFYWA